MKGFDLYFSQLRAMLARNATLKKREKRKTFAEVILPLYSFAVLAFLKISIPNPNFPAVDNPSFSSRIFDNYSLHLNYTLAVIPNSTEVQIFLEEMSENWDKIRNNQGNKMNFIMFETKEDLQEQYWHDPSSIQTAIIFKTNDPAGDVVLEYEIRTNPSFVSAPTSAELYSQPLSCRENSHILAKALEQSHVLKVEDCPAYQYYASGFVTLQMLIDYTKIALVAGENFDIKQMQLQLFPKEAFTADWNILFRLVIPAYLVMSLSQFVTYLLMLVVTEKEKKIKEGMKIMGLKDSVFWLSWFIVYGVFVTVMSIVAVSSMFLLGVFQHSNFFLIFLLVLLYEFSIIFFSFMLTPFFNNARSAGIMGNFIINIFSLLYFIRVFISKTNTTLLWSMSLLSPAAFTLAMDKALTMDMSGNGLCFDNLWAGPGLSFGSSLIFLCFDNFLYAILAYYLDLVIPSEYGAKKEPWFFLNPFCKLFRFIFKRESSTKPKNYATSDFANNNDIEPVANCLKDKVGIEIVGLHKHYSPCRGAQVSAINGINLTIYEGQITAILGHNGAGKTTLFNILTGMTKPTSGTAYIFGHDIRKSEELSTVRKMFGVCPQHDTLFDNLTPREHLKLFSAIRGIPVSEQEDEIVRTLRNVDLTDRADTYTKNLSGGQKRKLSVGIAIIGSPKIMIFDEPTAGVDPYSRRYMWSLLQQNKAGKVILLTTHFMDEADILADRKAVISKGQLRCVGSSLFLKNKFGIGYHLTLVLDANNIGQDIVRLIKCHVPEVEVARQHGKELSLILPHHCVNKFAALFAELEYEISHGNRFKISSYGISMTTLEEVFLYLEKSEELDDEEGSIANRIVKKRLGSKSRSVRRRRISAHSANTRIPENIGERRPSSPVTGLGLHSIQVNPNALQTSIAMIKLRLLNICREPSRFILVALVPLLFSAAGLYLDVKTTHDNKMKSLLLNESTYENFSISIPQEQSHLDFVQYLNIPLYPLFEGKSDLLKSKPHVGAFKVSKCCKEIDITIFYNDTAMHSLPIMINTLNNALYKMFVKEKYNDTSEEAKIITKSFPFLTKSQPEKFDVGLFYCAVCLGAAFCAIPIIFATDYVYDREIRAKNLLRVNGLKFPLYYGTFFVVLVFMMLIILSLHLSLIKFFDLPPFREPAAFSILAFLLILYVPCSILFSSTLSYLFNKAETTQSILLNFASFIGLLPFGLIVLLDLIKVGPAYMFTVHTIFSLLDTFYLPFAIIYFVGRVFLLCLANEACVYLTITDYFTPEIIIILASCLLQIPLFVVLLRMLELWKCGRSMKSFFICSKKKTVSESSINIVTSNDDEDDNDDVKFEKYRVANFMNSMTDSPDHPLIIVQDLKKEYGPNLSKNMFHKCFPKKKKESKNSKLAIANISFAVGPGEIFGLLGHNGAGKTTAMKIIIAEEVPTEGNIQIKGTNIIQGSLGEVFKYLGYCPQSDVLWKNITVREHIELYAAIRGVPPEKINEIVNTYLTALQIQEHADKLSHQCSGGTKRKLSFAIAMVGNPSVVLMDEPSVGMDPHSKRFLWDTILCSFQGSRGAILTTHAMEEADALCSRVGIMVNGKLRCIGSTQHLKNLYGAGYTLEVKINSDDGSGTEKEEKIKEFVNNVFPLATLEETFTDHLVFSIPQSSVRSLAHCFSTIENAKNTLCIEEYSFSQTTLEQVFLKFAHSDTKLY
ncbi:uncharacterized protein LOC135832246 isoform X2 [Planococcus citri]|uniref:uncharacterized protein LOC135832246 isoform X2 n=1 Tax=Planococcus citri TaxID=170843 RepID=UPI0031F9FE35